jgi:peptide/nickel transport system substrate-binding protein
MQRVRLSVLVGVLVTIPLVVWLTAASGQSPSAAPKKGGVLKVGMIGEPPTLDQHVTTAVITREIGIGMFETLYALDAKYQPIPLLVEGHEILDGGKRYVFKLRKGVKFHNGKEMTSADVVASLRRWGALASPGKATFKNVESVEAKGPSTVEMRLKDPSGSLLTVLAQVDNAAVIYPKEVIEATGEGQLKDFIGTGPFKFVEHKPDRHIKLVRFDGYSPRPEPADGLGGQRIAYVDELYFIPVPDYATRQAAIVTGEYNYVQQIKPDQYDRIRSAPGVDAVIAKPYGWAVAVLNTKQGLMADKRIRQAMQAALDMEPTMLAAMGHKDFYRLDPGLFFPEQTWHSKAGAALYNQHDKEKARRLLKEAGYQGQPVRWSVTTEYEHHYKPALVAKNQLEEVGFKIDLQVADWATVVQRRNKPEIWDVSSTAYVFVPEPSTSSQVLCDWPGWWCNPEKDQLLQAMAKEVDAKKRFAIWEKVQTMFYADAARIKFGDYYRLDAKRKEVQGYQPGPYMHFWNVWLEKR